MELKTSPTSPCTQKFHDYQSSVDTSRPFSSVKEAVAVFGERILVGSAYISPARDTNSWTIIPASPSHIEKTTPILKNDIVETTLKKMEAELEETKAEVKRLKEREEETEAAVAAINAKLRRTMSEEERENELKKRMENNTTLAQILSLGLGDENDIMTMSHYFGMRSSLVMNNNKKLKPIVPLVGDFIPWLKKKSTSTTSLRTSLRNSLNNSPSTKLYH